MGPSRNHPLAQNPLFGELPWISRNLDSINPWWRGEEGMPHPPFRRWPFARLLRMLRKGMTPAVVVRGPRRVGKTILLQQAIQALLAEGIEAKRILYVPFDELPTLRGIPEPILAISRWFERNVLGETFNQAANERQPAFLFFEVQNLDVRSQEPGGQPSVRALVTGSSSLWIEPGALAGRIHP